MAVDVELAGRIVDFLNELLEIDGNTIRDLVETRVQCNQKLADHPTVQVVDPPHSRFPRVGLLGILNGLCGIYDEGSKKGYGAIAAAFSSEGIICFSVVRNEP